MGLVHSPKMKHWCYNHQTKWHQIEAEIITSHSDIQDFLESQGFLLEPALVNGDEFNFLALFEHPTKDLYLFHFIIDDFCKFVYADSFPGAMFILSELNYLLNSHFRTKKILTELNEDLCSD